MAFVNPTQQNPVTNNSQPVVTNSSSTLVQQTDPSVNNVADSSPVVPLRDTIITSPDSNIENLSQTETALEPTVEALQNSTELNVDSIISEISEDLNNQSRGEIVSDNNQDIIAPNTTELEKVEETTLPVASNVVTYNLNATDTFQDNYANQIEVSNPISINSSDAGIKVIKPLEDNIPAQVFSEIDASKNLQYKNYTLNEILTEALNRNASDVHLTPGYRATFRIDGALKTFNSPILSPQDVKNYAADISKAREDVDLENIKEADLTYTIGTKRFRVNIFKQMGVYSVVCRIINENIATIDALGLPPSLNDLTKMANGLVLVTGPTGSGKSTTLASLLNAINLTVSKHIITLEDPVEYVLPKGLSLIDQREYGIDFSSWPTALRSVLRQDPDIVLIGEMRDLESIEAALQVAETGHLVFATLHTNSAAQSIDRIVDIFPAGKQDQIRIQLASVLRAVVSQRLVPLTAGGRIPAVELVVVNSAVQNSIRENKVYLIDNVIQTSAEEGMISLEKSLVQMVKEGKISAQTAKSLSVKPDQIDMLLNK